MARKRKLEYEISGKFDGGAFDKADRKAGGLGGKLQKFGKAAALGLAGVGVAAVTMGMDFVQAAEESQRVTKDTAAVIKSMGGVANVTADDVAKLSEKLSLKTGVDDELIQSGQNLLLTFGNIRNEVGKGNDIFNQASAVAVDFAARFKTDIPGASKIVGKALNDPIKGITALSRAGVQFTDQQKAQIRAMVESGDILGAQKLIMGELRRETEGSAAAQATASDKLKVAWGNLQETLGEKLLPVVERFTTWLTNTGIPAIERMVGWIDNNKGAMIALAAIVGGILTAAFIAWAASVIAATWPIILIGVIVGGVALLVVKHFDTIKGAFMGAFNWLKRNWPLVLAILTGPIGLAALAITKHWDKIKSGVRSVKDTIVGVFNWARDRAVGAIRAISDRFWDTVRSIRDAISWVKGKISSFVNNIPGAGIIKKAVGLIPGLASGGIVPQFLAHGGFARRGSDTVPAMLTPGEMVLNGHQQAALWAAANGGGGGGGDTYVLDMKGAIIADERQFRQMVVRALRDAGAKGVPLTSRGRAFA